MSNIVKAAENSTSPTCEWHGQGELCDNPSYLGRNYCEQHLWRVYQQGTKVRRRPRKERQQITQEEVMEDLRMAYEELVLEGKI